jgi:hypothetical protein
MGVELVSDIRERTLARVCKNIVVRKIFASRRDELVAEA